MTEKLSPSARRTLVRLAYLSPLLCGLILLILAAVPHLYFVYDGEAHETLSTLSLVSNTFGDCTAILNGSVEASNFAVVFSYAMIFFCILFWVGVITYAIMALSSAICSAVAFSYPPTAREANRAKRYFRLFCANRVLYVIPHLLIPLSAAFPQILLYFYRNQLGYRGMSLHFFGLSDLILATVLMALCLIAHFALLPTQTREHMDLFRLYKSKKQ
jgi:hypothetical protein